MAAVTDLKAQIQGDVEVVPVQVDYSRSESLQEIGGGGGSGTLDDISSRCAPLLASTIWRTEEDRYRELVAAASVDRTGQCNLSPRVSSRPHGFHVQGCELPHLHHLSEKTTSKMARELESIDSRPQTSFASRRHSLNIRAKKSNESLWKSVLLCLIGVCVGIVGFVLFQSIQRLSTWRKDVVTSLVSGSGSDAGAFFAWAGLSALMAAASTTCVYLRPQAGGSGVPDVMAYLNGVHFRGVFNIKTLVAKTASCILAVSSGLPVGPEGPMIHIGSLIGAGLGSGRSKTLHQRLRLGRRQWLWTDMGDADLRDCITGGAAAGVTVAFGAPIGGLLFVFEEVATHWRSNLSSMIFAGCLSASAVYGLFATQLEGWTVRGDHPSFGYFSDDATILFKAFTDRELHFGDLVPAALLGGFCGLLGTAFIWINIRVVRFRMTRSKRFKVIEPVVVVILYCAVCFGIGYVRSCRKLDEPHDPAKAETGDEADPETFVTAVCDEDGYFSPAATLFWNSGESVIKLLFRRRTAFDAVSLGLFAVIYFLFSCYSCGMFVSSGIVIPMLVTGGAVGRLMGGFINSYIDSSQHEGVYAVVGAAAYFAGVGRLTVSLAVIMIELTNDFRYLLPIMVAVLVAKIVGDNFGHSLYHLLLHERDIPFLDAGELEKVGGLDSCPIDRILHNRQPVICLKSQETLGSLEHVLKNARGRNGAPVNAFPVVDDEWHFLGLARRDTLNNLIRHMDMLWAQATAEQREQLSAKQHGDLTGLELAAATARFGDLRDVGEEAFLSNEPAPTATPLAAVREESWSGFRGGRQHLRIALLPHADMSAVSVASACDIATVLEIFTSLGLRHLVVTDESNRVGALLTRKDLLPGRLLRGLSRVSVMAGSGERGELVQSPRGCYEDDSDEAVSPAWGHRGIGP